MKKYTIVIDTCLGVIEVKNIKAESESEAFNKASEQATRDVVNAVKRSFVLLQLHEHPNTEQDERNDLSADN